jgi:hypothetical protein
MDYFRELVDKYSSYVEAVIFMITCWWGPVPFRLLPKLLELGDDDFIHVSVIVKTFVYVTSFISTTITYHLLMECNIIN